MEQGSQPINVMIVDDHPLFRAGLQRALEYERDIVVVGTSADGEDALQLSEQRVPHVMLLDINLPTLNGLQVARQLSLRPNAPAVIILTAHHDDEQVIYAFSMGASAYCTKDVHPDTLVAIIRDVARGRYVVDGGRRLSKQELSTWLQRKTQAHRGGYDEQGLVSPLSSREMQILAYVTKGLLNKEIAVRLNISQQTVKNHITSILKKLNVKDRTQAAVVALRRGWVRFNELSEQEA
jgi:DNA-binding NarL/FixJ family response regulator